MMEDEMTFAAIRVEMAANAGQAGGHHPAVDLGIACLCAEAVGVMEAMFERLPEYRLACALTPAEGLQLARAEQPALILLDVQMPEMNGHEVLQRLRAREDTRAIPVVAVSADAMAENIAVMMDAGAAAYLTKPVELEDLVAALQRHARAVTAPRG